MKKIVFLLLFLFIFLLIIFHSNKNKNIENKITIKFSSWGSQSETIIINKLIKKYENDNPNIKIDFIHIPQNYFQKIQLLFASNLEPDVIFINNQNIKMYIKADMLEDLTSYIKKELYFNEALNCFKYNDKIYAIPRDISTLVIYYNKDMLKNAGINPNKDIKDIFSLKDSAIKLTNKNHFGINFEEDVLYWSYYLASNGGGIFSDDIKKLIITKPESIEALQLYTDLVNKYHAAPTKAEIGSMTTAQMFINKKIAMYLGGRWMTPKFRETINFDWDIINFPTTDNNKVYIDSSGWAVSKKSKNKAEAIKFIQFLSNDESLKEISKTGLIIPAKIKVAKSLIENDKNNKPTHSYLFIEMLSKTKPTPVNENYKIINDIIKESTEPLFNGKKDIKNAFNKKTVKKLESLI